MAAWSVDQPPSVPSIIGAKSNSLWPCWERESGDVGVDTSMNIRSLLKRSKSHSPGQNK